MAAPDRNMALEMVRATEAAAMAAGRWMGKGDKNATEAAAVHAMWNMLNSVAMDGQIVIGEGEKGKAPYLFTGEKVGTEDPPSVDLAVDPIDGTRLTSLGLPGAISVVAVSDRGSIYTPPQQFYMNKIVVGPEAADVIDIEAPVEENIQRVAKRKGKALDDITVVVLDRSRHEDLISEIRRAGARIKLIPDGDIAGALLTCKTPQGTDLLLGIGGSAEAVIIGCAIKAMGGNMQCQIWAKDAHEADQAREMGIDLDKIMGLDDLVKSENVFFAATGITDGEFLEGVRYEGRSIRTSSMVIRSRSGTIRYVEGIHKPQKLALISDVDYLKGI